MSNEIQPDPETDKSAVYPTENVGEPKDLSGAIDAENAEHAMTVLQAVRAYPMACFWAFIMAFTIVRTCITCCIRWLTHFFADHGILRRLPDGQLHGSHRVH